MTLAAPQFAAAVPTSFGALKQIDAGLLNVGYVEAGPADAPPVLLLHGWPYDIHSFVDVTPLLARAGYRVIVPHLRGHGTTRFLSAATLRNAQQAVVALDIVALMDALRIERAVLAGYDWGARTANIIAALMAPASDGTAYTARFSGRRTHRIINGVGHNLPQEAPQAFAEAVLEVDGY
jgi:pimeloyl-ACP methyl ester carboxylesterase